VKLDVEGRNYEKRIPVSHALEPSEADRFLIVVNVDRSSHHRFRLRLGLTGGEELSSGEIDLEAIVPRSWQELPQLGGR
jgi:hypothetical protein